MVDYQQLRLLMNEIDWRQQFIGYISVDDYASLFTNTLHSAILEFTVNCRSFKKARLPMHIVRLLRTKKNAWRLAKQIGDHSAYKNVSRASRGAIRQFRRNQENRILFTKDNKLFFPSYATSLAIESKSYVCM
jgi:hypothetical protein